MAIVDDILIGIVTYNPEIERLRENITAILKQANHVLIVDNSSLNFNDFLDKLPNNITYIRNKENEGIARALSQIMEYALENSFKWVLTLDQDSIIEPGLIEEYMKYVNRPDLQNVGMFTCLIKDRNFSDEKHEKQNQDLVEVPYCITSAAFTNTKKYFATSGYDIDFFIDAVDFDICYSLRECGYKIVRINFIGLYHEVGHGENRRFLWKKIVVYHQKAFRIYYLARNTVLMYRKHKELFPWFVMVKKEVTIFFKILLYENDKAIKMKNFFKGIGIR